jgi:hypothetical protein
MGNISVSDYSGLIKQQFSIQERLLEHHLKIESLVELMATRDLCKYSVSRLHQCFLVIFDLNNSAMKLNEEAMDNLIKVNRILNPQKPPSFSWLSGWL